MSRLVPHGPTFASHASPKCLQEVGFWMTYFPRNRSLDDLCSKNFLFDDFLAKMSFLVADFFLEQIHYPSSIICHPLSIIHQPLSIIHYGHPSAKCQWPMV